MRQPRHNQYERLSCMKTKGIYPYSWAESASCYNLPYLVEKEHFFNSLTHSHITDDEYNFAKKVWSTFEMKTMNDYCRMYCLTGNLERLLHGSMRHVLYSLVSNFPGFCPLCGQKPEKFETKQSFNFKKFRMKR